MKPISLIYIIFFLTAINLNLAADEKHEQPNEPPDIALSTMQDIFTIANESELTYEIYTIDADSFILNRKLPDRLYSDYYLETTENGTSLKRYNGSDSSLQLWSLADTAFKYKEYEKSRELYRSVLEIEPGLHSAITMIADVFYMENRFDSAIYYFEDAIDKNFIDYCAHWFLGDLLWKTGDMDGAIRELTYAHILNMYHPDILNILKKYRSERGIPWKDWKFEPVYDISFVNNKVKVGCSPEYVGFALTMAVWEYEPGYAQSKGVDSINNHLIIPMREKESILNYLSPPENDLNVYEIVANGDIDEFIHYEIAAKKHPIVILLLPREFQENIVDYLLQYH